MARGFIYIVRSVTPNYVQENFFNVPTEWKGRLYFGQCKVSMRPKMGHEDWVFGISPARTAPRRIVFIANLEERITFAEAYDRFPDLRGPEGPISVRPVDWVGRRFPESSYEHIPRAEHADRWKLDLKSKELDAFFVCRKQDGCRGRWLGKYGPEIDDEILQFLKGCSVYGQRKDPLGMNSSATKEKPIGHGELHIGLHLETDQAERLLKLCDDGLGGTTLPDPPLTPQHPSGASGGCGVRAPESSANKPVRGIKHRC